MGRILLLALLLFGPAAAATPAKTLLVMGDSLSAAYGIEVSQGWVTLLQERLKARGYDYTVVNGSVSGETTEGGLTRLPQELTEHKPAVVILELGANDGLEGKPVPSMQENLGRMVALSRQAGARVLLVGIVLPPNYGEAYRQQFDQAYTALAKQYKLPFLPFLLDGVAQHRGMMQGDGMHPLASAEPKVLDNVWSKLLPLLGK